MAPFVKFSSGIKFNLFKDFEDTVRSISQQASKEKVCIVSVIGKSTLQANGCKASLIDHDLGRNIFQGKLADPLILDKSTGCDIRGYFDPENHVIFLHLIGTFDTAALVQVCKSAEAELKAKSFLEVWSDMQCKVAKALLFFFHISHIVLVVHPTANFDVSYIYIFRTLDTIRQKSIPHLSELLKGFPISSDWIQAGRPCSPRVLFIFQTCPPEMRSTATTGGDSIGRTKSRKIPIKKLEHALEDQIYRILRKSRVITNISGNSLFAVPANQEFVYIATSDVSVTDPMAFFLNQLRNFCDPSKEATATDPNSTPSFLAMDVPPPNGFSKHLQSGDSFSQHSFHTFLWQHIDLALTKGFDDNVGRHPVAAFFELPTAQTWFQICEKLKGCFFKEPKDARSRAIHSSLKTALDIDVRFSEGRCGKVLPIASSAYQENLPSHYTTEYHQTKLAHALQVFALHARGPAFHRYAQQLKEDCERLWMSGHQMCEVLSLTGNHCVNPLHRVDIISDGDSANRTLPIMPHCSQVKLISTCDCGRRQATREDPFDVKAANFDFYASLHADCCGELERIEFPIFQPGSGESRPARLSPWTYPSEAGTSKMGKDSSKLCVTDSSHLAHGSGLGLSSGGSDIFPGAEAGTRLSQDRDQTPKEDRGDEIVIQIREGSDDSATTKTGNDKTLVRQPSTTEYLPGMLHSQSPPGLLPQFSSWSLVCLGPSSLYSHNIGIQDQPGFIQGTNFLLPWDVTVKLEQKDRWPSYWEGKRPGLKGKKGGKDGTQFTVKIFIGVEYECPRGHRFMCSAPDRVLRATSSGLVKDNANKVTGSDMPLYFPCPCRTGKPWIAQLMRLHVVTPKAPVHVTLNPQVQPSPMPCPIFHPGNSEPAKLSQSAYWVLRLPFVYEGNQGPYLPPKEPVPLESCRLLKGTYGIAEHSLER